jgi:hypothetical protein
VSEPIYSRAPDVVWRLAPDRVLVRPIRSQDKDVAVDLIGDAALAWIALDEPATEQELVERLADADMNGDPTAGTRLLIDSKLVGEIEVE